MNRIKYMFSVRSWNKNFFKSLEVTKNRRIFAQDLLTMEEEYGKLYQI